MPNNSSLTFDRLHAAVAGNAAAVRSVTRLGPVGGPTDKIFPPTYEGGRYATEKRTISGQIVETVLLDSVQSQANRIEQALLTAFQAGSCKIPVLSVQIPRANAIPTTVTALDAPHRLWDAIFRDSRWGGKEFRKSPQGNRLVNARPEDATPFFEYCPTALIFGMWDSTSGEGGVHGNKWARALASEIVGLNAVYGHKTSSRIDPLGITADAARIFRSDKDLWTLDERDAIKEKGKPVLFGTKASKAGKPSAINHGNITPTVSNDGESGGVTISEAVQTTVLSFPQLRRLRFPDPETRKASSERDVAGRTVLAALALFGMALQREEGYFLRSRCHLIPLEPPRNELLGATAHEVQPFSLSAADAQKLFEQAVRQAADVGLTWKAGLIALEPTEKLAELVRRSDEKVQAEGGEDAGN